MMIFLQVYCLLSQEISEVMFYFQKQKFHSNEEVAYKTNAWETWNKQLEYQVRPCVCENGR